MRLSNLILAESSDEKAINLVILHGSKHTTGLDQSTHPVWMVEERKLPALVIPVLKNLYDHDARVEFDGHLYTVDKPLSGHWSVKRWR